MLIDACSSLVEQSSGSKRQTKLWRRCRRIGPFSSVRSQRDAPDWRLFEPKLLRKWPDLLSPWVILSRQRTCKDSKSWSRTSAAKSVLSRRGEKTSGAVQRSCGNFDERTSSCDDSGDEHPHSASAHHPRAAKCDSTEEADGRQVFAIAEGVATGSTFA